LDSPRAVNTLDISTIVDTGKKNPEKTLSSKVFPEGSSQVPIQVAVRRSPGFWPQDDRSSPRLVEKQSRLPPSKSTGEARQESHSQSG
jgi:hypothetical protein